ncbi:MAG: hypothetical protein ABIP69_04680, partial [Ferruginibacter sp.]
QQNADYSSRRAIVAVPTFGVTEEGDYVDFLSAKTVEGYKVRIDNGEDPKDPPVNTNQVRAVNHFKLCPPDIGCAQSNLIWDNL